MDTLVGGHLPLYLGIHAIGTSVDIRTSTADHVIRKYHKII